MADKTVFQPASGGVRSGTRLNGVYEIERLIAQGGMGEVYKGFNIQTGDPVAIKMVRPEMSRNDDVLALFRREASTLHNLQHEAIVRYFVFSVDPDLQRAYLAMEYVDGPSLATRLAQGPLSPAEVGILFNRIAPALDEAHRLGVIHRDISSDNFILPDGDMRKAKLIDFGIARSRRPNEGTIIGDGFAGKYNYVSPEQLGLAGGDVTGKSDVYSFGLVLAEALRGKPIDMGGSQVEIIEKRRRIPDLSDIPPAFRPLLKSMLEPDPANRPATLTSLAAFDAAGRASSPLNSKSANGRGGGGLLIAAAVGLIVVSLGAVGYVFRDAASDWLRGAPQIPIATETPKATKLPPLGGETATPTPEPTPMATPSPSPSSAELSPATPTPTTAPTPIATKTPGLAELLDEVPPRAPQALVALPAATVGAAYKASIPAFSDPGRKGLHLQADAPPAGLNFTDRGDGSSELSGMPSKPGATTFVITATNHNGRSAKLTATISIAAASASPSPSPSASVAPPASIAPSQANVLLEDAVAGRDYNAMLPPFSSGPGSKVLTLHAEPNPPEGLAFADAGSGFSRLSGKPSQPGVYNFAIVAADSTGASGRMAVKLVVAPAPPSASPTPSPSVAPAPQIAPSQADVVFDDAVAGRDYNAALPPFRAGPDSKGLTLHTEPAPPEGLTFVDAGGGLGRLSGKPSQPGGYNFEIVAVDATGASARMAVRLIVAPAPPSASPTPSPSVAPTRPTPAQTDVRLDDAVAGRDYNATLPPFLAGPGSQGLTLHAEPNPPDGLTFDDSGGGFSQLSGKPTRPGAYDFAIVAADANGARNQMQVKLVVAPPPAEAVAPNGQDKALAMLRTYSGDACFFARPQGASHDGAAIEAIGSDRGAFTRFEAAFKREVGVEPDIAAKLIVPAECPALALMKLPTEGAAAAPTIDLTSAEVGTAHPLAGTVRGLAGRRLVLLAVDNDGEAHLLPSTIAATGDAATFSVPLSGDAESIGPLQTLLAVASNAPFAAFDHYRPGPVADLAARLRPDWAKAGAVANAAFFKLTK